MFSLNNTDISFKSRQASVFDNLVASEDKQLPMPRSKQTAASLTSDESRGRQSSTVNCSMDIKNDNRESEAPVFKRPSLKGFKQTNVNEGHRQEGQSGKNTGRYHGRHRYTNKPFTQTRKNPSKWVKYDLSDVSSEQISDRANTAAAFSFLEERRKSLVKPEKWDEDEVSTSKKIVFKKRKVAFEGDTSVKDMKDEKSSFVDGKLRMAEYVIGRTAKKQKKDRTNKTFAAAGSMVSLSHLDESEQQE